MYNQRTRLFWICLIIAFIFIVLGSVSFLQKNIECDVALLASLWFLNMILLVIITFYAILLYPRCIVGIMIIFFIALLFSTLWVMQYNVNLMYANMSIVVTIIALLVLIQFTQISMLPLAVLSLLVWFILFFYININKPSP